MTSFLYRIAHEFYKQHGSEISQLTFVFPNRRAGLFFQRHLASLAEGPIFSPEILTINECFSLASNWQTADRLSNLFRLYRIFKNLSASEESFDSFVFWGEMLLSDFDDVDKYRVNASQLFSNITELKEIDRLFNIFTDKQIEAIRQFWSNFVPVVEGKTQEEFIATWQILHDVYEQFRNELITQNSGTEGMICRDVVDRLQAKETIDAFNEKQFIFVGFNALNPCERGLMAQLQKRGQADFYWDYEAAELRDPENPASRFYAENIHIFPSKYNIAPIIEDSDNKEFELIAVPSAVGQAKQAYAILDKLYPANIPNSSWIETAVVLPDESLLIPLLHSIPQQIDKVNVTMGFPLSSTPISGLIEHIFELQRKNRTSGNRTSFYHINVSNILNHQYIAQICGTESKAICSKMAQNNLIYVDSEELKSNELLKSIFEPQTESTGFLKYILNIIQQLQLSWKQKNADSDQLNLESDFLYQYYISINRMVDIMNEMSNDIGINIETLMRLTRQLTAGISIPFLGEPLEGLQIMGVLETRGLDFDNLIISSFNENIFPKKTSANSFIPYNLRKGFELPTFEHQDAITSYNFYRLINRAKRIFLMYDSRTEGMQTGEVSRFLQQLHYHYAAKIKYKNVGFDISFANPKNIQIDKSPEVLLKLQRFLSNNENSKSLSASSIKNYIECPLQFYLTRVEEVEQADEVKETIEDNMFGNLFHATMEYIYQPYKGQMIQPDDFNAIIENTLNIDINIKRAFCEKYFKKKFDVKIKLEGNNLLIAHVIRKYILQVLRTDKQHAPFKYIDSEKVCKIQYPISNGLVNIKGFIDRIDEKNGKIRILDYKTGSGKLEFRSWDEVFEHNNDKRPKYVLQTFLYGVLYQSEAENKIITPGIYYMRDVFKDGFVTELKFKPDSKTNIIVEDFAEFENDFRTRLTSCLEEIFDPTIPFVQTTSNEPCKYCPYIGICNR